MESHTQLMIFHWLLPLGLTSAVAALYILLCNSCTIILPPRFHYNLLLPAIKSHGAQSLRHLWSLLLLLRIDDAPAMTSPNLFLLVNLTIFLILLSLHLQQRSAAASAARKPRKKRKISEAHAEALNIDCIQSPQPLQYHDGSSPASREEEEDGHAAAAMPSSAADGSAVTSPRLVESGSDQAHPLAFVEESSPNEGFISREASMETLPADADMGAAVDSEPSWTVVERPGARVEKIVLEQDGRLRLVEVTDGSDAPNSEDERIDAPHDYKHVKVHRTQHTGGTNSTNSDDLPNTLSSGSGSGSGLKTSHPLSSDRNCAHPSSNLPFKKPCEVSHGHYVPKSISLNSRNLMTSDDTTFSRPRVKSMDATNDNTLGSGISRENKVKSNVVKRAFRLRREPSINTQDELNARVESFIAAFNEKIKIQRQQSLLSYMEMVDRGA